MNNNQSDKMVLNDKTLTNWIAESDNYCSKMLKREEQEVSKFECWSGGRSENQGYASWSSSGKSNSQSSSSKISLNNTTVFSSNGPFKF